MRNSVRGVQTRLEVLRGNFVAFTHPVHTQKQLFGILGHVSTMIMLGTSAKKKHTFWYLKKNVAKWMDVGSENWF